MRRFLLLCLVGGLLGLAASSAATATTTSPLVTQPGIVSFGVTPVGTTSDYLWVNFTNKSTQMIAWTQMGIYNTNAQSYSPQDFYWVDPWNPPWNTCENVAPGASCHMAIKFKPSAVGFMRAMFWVNWWGYSSWKTIATTNTILTGIGFFDLSIPKS